MKLVATLVTLLSGIATPASAAPAYRVTTSVPLGAPDRWDYVVFDARTARVYVAHGNRVDVVGAGSASLVGHVDGIEGGTHGTAISVATGQGFTDDGKAGTAIAYDLATRQITHRIQADVDADAIALDKKTGHVFVVEGDPGAITVIDPASDRAIATIKAGEKMEYAVSGADGAVYVAGEEKGDLIRIDARTNAVLAHWAAPACVSPHGLAIDEAHARLFMGCSNSVLIVMDAGDGHVVATLPIGRGNDAVAYDPKRQRVFSSNGLDGTITIYQQSGADRYTALDTIKTVVSGRTMAVDPASGRLFVAAAETDPGPKPGARPIVRPGTLKLLVLDPAR